MSEQTWFDSRDDPSIFSVKKCLLSLAGHRDFSIRMNHRMILYSSSLLSCFPIVIIKSIFLSIVNVFSKKIKQEAGKGLFKKKDFKNYA